MEQTHKHTNSTHSLYEWRIKLKKIKRVCVYIVFYIALRISWLWTWMGKVYEQRVSVQNVQICNVNSEQHDRLHIIMVVMNVVNFENCIRKIKQILCKTCGVHCRTRDEHTTSFIGWLLCVMFMCFMYAKWQWKWRILPLPPSRTHVVRLSDFIRAIIVS